MKKSILLFTFSMLSVYAVMAQITVVRSDFGVAGDSINYGVDTTFTGSVNIGAAGAGKTWNLDSTVKADMQDPTKVYDGSFDPTAPSGTNIIVVNQRDGQMNYHIDSLSARAQINSPVNPTDIIGFRIADFPMSYGKSFSDSTFLNTKLSAASIGITGIDSLWLKISIVNKVLCDGWGTLITEGGSYNVLRVKNVNIQTTGIYVKGTLTFNSWIHYTDSVSKLYEYTFLGKNAKYFIAKATTDSLDNIQEISYVLPVIHSGLTSISANKLELIAYPNPVQDLLHITFRNPSGNATMAELLDLTGKRVSFSEQSTSGTIQLNTAELSNGVYFCHVYNNEFSVTQKVLISK